MDSGVGVVCGKLESNESDVTNIRQTSLSIELLVLSPVIRVTYVCDPTALQNDLR